MTKDNLNAKKSEKKVQRVCKVQKGSYICNRLERIVFKLSVDSVAQLVEHLTFNQRVLGSNPSGITL